METHIAEADILNQSRVHVHLSDDLLHELEDDAIDRRVLESTLETLGERCADGEGNDNIVGILGGTAIRGLAFCHSDRRGAAKEWCKHTLPRARSSTERCGKRWT